MANDTQEVPGEAQYFHMVRFRYGGPDELFAAWTGWLDHVHIPAVLAVPGIRSFRRYAELGSNRDFLTAWLIDGPHVFEEPSYVAARGWGPWEEHMEQWTISLLRAAREPRRFGTATASDPPL